MRISTNLFGLLIFCLILSSCAEEKVPAPFKPRNDHEAYQHALEQANLISTALGTDWKAAAESSLENPVMVNAPYEEAFYLDPNEAAAMSYRFLAKRGQKIQVSFSAHNEENAQLFVDLYRINEDSQYSHVATADKTSLQLGFEPRKDAEYVLRFQPELLRGGSFKVTIENVPTLAFPVAGKNARAIGSVWGDPRDGGRRKHEGVDIFARRGTPVLAPTKAYVRFVGERGIGGKVVWLYDSKRGQSLYFAHLNELIAKQGTTVEPGDTLGTVGNTGNARTTPPHLHFGVYKNGAVNPFFYLQDPPAQIRPVGNDFGLLGTYARLNRNSRIKTEPSSREYQHTWSKDELARVIAVNNNSYRIMLPNGEQGYIGKRYLNSAESPLETLELNVDGDFLKRPDDKTLSRSLVAGEQVSVLGRHEDYWFVKNELGETGWITDQQKRAQRPLRIDPD